MLLHCICARDGIGLIGHFGNYRTGMDVDETDDCSGFVNVMTYIEFQSQHLCTTPMSSFFLVFVVMLIIAIGCILAINKHDPKIHPTVVRTY